MTAKHIKCDIIIWMSFWRLDIGYRTNSSRAIQCSRTQVKKAFKDLILKAKAKYIFLSYDNESLMTLVDIKEAMGLRGKCGYFAKRCNRFKADKSENRNYTADKTMEYLHYVTCE